MLGACSLAPHIVANEARIALDLIKVDGKTKKTETDQDFLTTNPNGYVPTLVLDDRQTLTEAQLVVQYLADQKPRKRADAACGGDGALPCPAAAGLHLPGIAQVLQPVLQAGYAGTDENHQSRASREAAWFLG